jgi:hypothetical protein
MSKKGKGARLREASDGFVACLRHFLTPAVYKQAHQADPRGKRHGNCRWTVQPLILTLLVMTWCCGDSQPERFEIARGFYVSLNHKRRRPGETVAGFQDALASLPMVVLRTFAAALRRCLLRRLGQLKVDGFIPFGCDGSRLTCPRVAQLEQRLGGGSNNNAPPLVWITALVHLTTGLLWSWRIGKGNASERDHLQRLLPTLPADALVVADAGYQGVDLARALLDAGADFLIRMSSQTTLYTLVVPVEGWSSGMVMYWTIQDQRDGKLPLLLRLIRIHEPRRKVDVWLLSNVLCHKRLSNEAAARFYQLRWENEGFFRTYKRTLAKVKLASRSVRLLHREVEGSLLAVQLLLAQGMWARAALAAKETASSPRALVVEIRKEIDRVRGAKVRTHGTYRQRVQQAQRKQRKRKTSKVKRVWPSRVPHKPPQPPDLRTMTDDLINLLHKRLGVA